MPANRKSKAVAVGVGRPSGVGNLTPVERINRDLDNIIDAMRKTALAGDAAAAELCLRIANRHPDQQEITLEKPPPAT